MIPRLLREIVPAALTFLPPRMDSPPARALLLAIAMQESRGRHRRQIAGPARGLWQFETAGVAGVLRHEATKGHAADLMDTLAYPATAESSGPHTAIEHNDLLACGFARLLLWTDPFPLPHRDQPGEAYEAYIRTWRPGRPRVESWAPYYRAAWEVVEP